MLPAVVGWIAYALHLGNAYAQTISLEVNATQAVRGIFHSHLTIPVEPGPLTLNYPRWIPGEHSPFGPIQQLTGVKFTAGGEPLRWQRDPLDLFSFQLNVPAGLAVIEAEFDYLSPPVSFGDGYGEGPNVTEHLFVLLWNQQVLAPRNKPAEQVLVRAVLRLPPGWSFDTALPIEKSTGELVEFRPVSLTTLVDSPVLAGDRFRTIKIAEGEAPVRMSLAADELKDTAISPERVAQFGRVVEEARSMFGARHYQSYVWLVALTDAFDVNGLEHHESSDNRMPAELFRDEVRALAEMRILPHEYVHSWNGKYRRPVGLATQDYQQPMDGTLLWIYEGLTRYLGDVVLTSRGGLREPQTTRDYLAWMASTFQDGRPGRRWRSVADTAASAQLLLGAPSAWSAVRRGPDYYDEAALIWLEADVLIRRQSQGTRSLDNFCQFFFGTPDSKPQVKPYGLEDLWSALQQVLPYDWPSFFRERIYDVGAKPPIAGLTNGGWQLVYGHEPNQFSSARAVTRKQIDWTYSLGLKISPEGKILDALPESPAFNSGLDAGWKIIGLNGVKWSPAVLSDSLERAEATKDSIEFTVERADRIRTVKVDFHGGATYPHLQRLPGVPDTLSEILTAHRSP